MQRFPHPVFAAAGFRTPFGSGGGVLASHFAAQVLTNVAAIEQPEWTRTKTGVQADLGAFPWERASPHGRSIANGHPFGATGARDLSQAVKELWSHPAGRAPSSASAPMGAGHGDHARTGLIHGTCSSMSAVCTT